MPLELTSDNIKSISEYFLQKIVASTRLKETRQYFHFAFFSVALSACKNNYKHVYVYLSSLQNIVN